MWWLEEGTESGSEHVEQSDRFRKCYAAFLLFPFVYTVCPVCLELFSKCLTVSWSVWIHNNITIISVCQFCHTYHNIFDQLLLLRYQYCDNIDSLTKRYDIDIIVKWPMSVWDWTRWTGQRETSFWLADQIKPSSRFRNVGLVSPDFTCRLSSGAACLVSELKIWMAAIVVTSVAADWVAKER